MTKKGKQMKNYAIKIDSLRAGDKTILHDIDETIEPGITLIVGKSGSGKTALVRRLVPKLTQVGELQGSVTYGDKPIKDTEVGTIGYISQNPDNQLVCDKVWHELAFGLESMGVREGLIRNRVAEVATVFGIDELFNKRTDELSGGQKQKVILASVLCMNPDVVVMDEPSSMLDPIATREFFELVVRLHEELRISFIIVEHNIDYLLSQAAKTIYMDEGTVIQKKPKTTRQKLIELLGEPGTQTVEPECAQERPVFFKQRSIRRQYDRKLALNIPKLELHEGITCLIGPNGAGKTTLAKELSGFFGKKKLPSVCMMPQDVLTIFVKDTVKEELLCIGDIGEDTETADHERYSDNRAVEENNSGRDNKSDVQKMIRSLLEPHFDSHPLDISGGEQHILAVCKTMLRGTELTILDEPTKGMDAETKEIIKELIIKGFDGRNVIIITHDLELVAEIAEHVIFMFNGDIASQGEVHDVLCGNTMYKPEISKMWEGAVRPTEVKRN